MMKKYVTDLEKNVVDIIIKYQTKQIDCLERYDLLNELTLDFKNLIIDHFIC